MRLPAARLVREHQAAGGQDPPSGTKWFAISYSEAWEGRLSAWLDSLLFRAGPGASGVAVDSGQIRVRMGSFKLDIPRSSLQSVRRSQAKAGRTAGVHSSRGRWLVNGSADGLIEITIEPPCYPAPSIDTLFGIGRSRVDSLLVSLEDPDGEVVLWLAIVPPLDRGTAWIDVVAAGQSAEVLARLPLRWK